jgi:hypothetical protein
MFSTRPPFRFLGAVAAIAAAFQLAGCESHHSKDPFFDAVAAGERPVAMQGVGAFFNGQVVATVTVSQGVGPGTRPRKGGSYPADGTGSMDEDQQKAYLLARGSLGSPLPPVTLRLTLDNHGLGPIQVDIREVNSDLGNFAVQPEVVLVPPGQTSSPDPMISQLGVTSDLIPVKVTLNLGGKSESQVIPVRNLQAPAAGP